MAFVSKRIAGAYRSSVMTSPRLRRGKRFAIRSRQLYGTAAPCRIPVGGVGRRLGSAQSCRQHEGVESALPSMLRELPPAVRKAMTRVAQIAITFALFSLCNAIAVNFEVEK